MAANALERFALLDGDYQHLLNKAQEYLRSVKGNSVRAEVVLRRADVDRALSMYEGGALSAEQLQGWADVLEMNDHICYEQHAEKAVADVLFRLSSPEINEPITRHLVGRLRASLSKPGSDRK